MDYIFKVNGANSIFPFLIIFFSFDLEKTPFFLKEEKCDCVILTSASKYIFFLFSQTILLQLNTKNYIQNSQKTFQEIIEKVMS